MNDKRAMTREIFTREIKKKVTEKGPVTAKAEQNARKTGKLNPLVDPAGYGVIRRSLPRFVKEGKFCRLAIGTPIPIEVRVDTTASMGNNVDVALRVLPDTYELCSGVLPGYDLQIAIGIFGDVSDDNFVLCRPQFEMEAEKIVEQLTLMVPERDGGDAPEDPHYGLFGAAYLTSTYINKIGLKGYDFTVSDAPARDRIDESQLYRIFGKEVFEKVAENGHQMKAIDLPNTAEVVHDLLKIAHAFFLQVGDSSATTEFWTKVFGHERVVILPSTELLPQVQATIIGLTEGTLRLEEVEKFLCKNNVEKTDAKHIVDSVANIPIGAQAILPNYSRRPKKGDLFKEKTDLWPVDNSGKDHNASAKSDAGPQWL